MASIPLPALDVRAPQQPDLLDKFKDIYALKQMANQRQLQQQQVQMNAQKLQQEQVQTQEAQQGQADQIAFRKLLADPTNKGKTIGEIADTAAQNNAISPQAWQQAKKLDLDQKKQLSELTEKDLANRKAAHDQTQQLFNNVMSMPDDQYLANWPQIAQQYDAIPGNNKTPLDPNKPLPKAQLQQFGPLIDMGNAYLDQEMARRKATAETDIKAREAQYGTPESNKAQYEYVLARMKQNLPVSPQEKAAAQAFEASEAKTSTTSDSLGITSVNSSRPNGIAMVGGGASRAGAPNGGGTTPANVQGNAKDNLVDMLGQYRADPGTLSRMFIKHPDVLAAVQAKYPDWDQTTYQAKNKLVQSYTSGPESRSINAISTALGHAGELGDAIDALQNSNGVNALRSLANRLGVSVLGDDKVTLFNTIVHRLAPEIASAYIQGGGGEKERVSNAEDFSPNLGDRQLRSNLTETIKLLRSKIETNEQQWNNTYRPSRPEDAFEQRFLTPRARAAFSKWSGDGSSGASGTGQQHAPGKQAGLPEGTTGTGSDGKPYIVKGGVWAPR